MTSKVVKHGTELPEVVRRHLSSTLGNADHPDAALLTAFVEGTLFRTHRDQVLSHLAACSECNRVVALIAPSPEESSARQPVAIRHRWFAWAPMRWAGVAAVAAVAAIVVSSVVVGRIGRQTKASPAPPVVVATSQSPSITAQPAVQATQPEAPRRGDKPSQRVLSSRQPAPTAAAAPRQVPAQAEPPITAQNRPAAPTGVSGQEAFQTAMISRAPAPTSEVATKSEPAPGSTPAPPAPTAAGPVWSVSEAGMLQRSNDSGRTWAGVAVPSRAPLRAVSVSGPEIWTGGDRGALYHSTDAGQTWLLVVPTANGLALSADITRIVFLDMHRGWIATRKGDIWTTRDGGATWALK